MSVSDKSLKGELVISSQNNLCACTNNLTHIFQSALVYF